MNHMILDLNDAEMDFVSGGDLHNGGKPPWYEWPPGLEPWAADDLT